MKSLPPFRLPSKRNFPPSSDSTHSYPPQGIFLRKSRSHLCRHFSFANHIFPIIRNIYVMSNCNICVAYICDICNIYVIYTHYLGHLSYFVALHCIASISPNFRASRVAPKASVEKLVSTMEGVHAVLCAYLHTSHSDWVFFIQIFSF